MKQGIVMEIQTNDAYIFTNDCSMVKMPVQKDMFVGQSIEMPEAVVRVLPRRRWLVPALAAACVLLLMISGFLAYTFVVPQAGTVYLSIDINPSIEFTLDTERNVIDVIPLNSDAWELLDEASLIGLNYQEAIVKWVKLVQEKKPEAFEDLLITAILDRRDHEFADQIMALDSDQTARQLADLAVWTSKCFSRPIRKSRKKQTSTSCRLAARCFSIWPVRKILISTSRKSEQVR